MPSREHQKGVRKTAIEHDRNGWDLKADLRGWPHPPIVAGRRPDVVATKRGSRRIIETERSRGAHGDQHTAFRRHASQKTNTIFFGCVVNAAGRHVERFDRREPVSVLPFVDTS